LFTLTYEELRRLASSVRRGDPSATLNPTALVNEAWIKLAKSPEITTTSQLHFKRIAARAMRQVLTEAARRRNAEKRGGGVEVTVNFEDSFQKAPSTGSDLLRLDRALDELARMNQRQAILEPPFRRARRVEILNRTKTKASKAPVPMCEALARSLNELRRQTEYWQG
jgi:RNA polymerase sigma factor (TIGR02999 family)